MKIGLLSDTHGWLDSKILDFFKDCDEVWHCGDIGDLAVTDRLAANFNLRAVSDNNPIFISSYALLIYKASLFLPPSFLHREFPESAAYDRNGDLS